ncbi:unnamed protein product [Brachionus calyciflorus]|uniref:ATPase AAA-type core domain-containing protein n=1 Tax=Brachionus calyciflorus TaxID=104777 RepID=A0A813ZCS6_9BILA|nr:unnamed protein product [Brachionus calyciflorus]
MKLKFDSFEPEFEIKGPFENNNQTIEFVQDEKKLIITGKNLSGKTQFISEFLDSINTFNNDHNNYNKIFIGYLAYNLAFNFDKTRVSNVHELDIDDKVIEFFNHLLNVENQDKDILVNNFFIYIGRRGTPLEVFKPFNLLTFFIKLNQKYNDISPIEDLNKDLSSLGISKNSITYENSSNKIILDKTPSSGELLILNFLVLKWIHTKVKKFEILLFDEPDRHFEPKIIEKFFKILNDVFKDTRIFLTTHRPDTILLSQNNTIKFKLAKTKSLKQNENDVSILEKYYGQTNDPSYRYFVLSTIFDLTYNLREIMNIKIRVYVESNDDYRFYKDLYNHLLDYCKFLRNLSINDKKFDTNKKQIFFDQFPILSRRYQLCFCTSALENDGGGGGIDKAENNQKRDSVQRELDLKDIKHFWDVDPMFLESDDKEKNYIEFTDDNLNAIFQKFKNDINQDNLDLFLKIFIKEVLTSKDTMVKIKKIHTIIYVKEYISKEILIIDKMIKIRKEKNLQDIKKLMEDFVEDNEENEIDDKVVDYLFDDCQKQTYYLTEKQSNNRPYFKVDLNYPSFFLNIDGKVLEAVLNKLLKHTKGFNLSSQIENKDYTKMWISQDFVKIFSSINNQVRVYPIYFLIETELKTRNQKKLERKDALAVVRKAGFSEKKFNLCLQSSSALKKMIS